MEYFILEHGQTIVNHSQDGPQVIAILVTLNHPWLAWAVFLLVIYLEKDIGSFGKA